MRSMIPVLVAASFGVAVAHSPFLGAQPGGSSQPAADLQRIGACSLISKEEVKQHLPWIAVLDSLPVEEDEVGASGSGCNYPSVYIQVLPFSQSALELMREQSELETIGGVGDEAYLRNNANEYAELYVRVGARMLTLQANMDGDIEAVKPGVIGLAQALVDKLP